MQGTAQPGKRDVCDHFLVFLQTAAVMTHVILRLLALFARLDGLSNIIAL